jgi:5-methylthioadenosine/S-adenosylhomocysteine deaminase
MQRIGVSPHAPYTVTRRLFESVRDYAAVEGLPLTIHIAESLAESQFIYYGEGPFADSHRERGFTVEALGISPIEHLYRMGLLKPRTLLIHAIQLDDRDIEILRHTRPAVVHCPKSNAKLAHGTARVEDMLRAGLSVGLGTDSVASNNTIDMFEEMRSAIFQQRTRTGRIDALDAAAALRMATLGGAECLGLSAEIGSLEAGKRADFVVVDLNDPALQPVYDPVEAMVYSASRRNVRETYLAGQAVRIESERLMQQAGSIADRLQQATADGPSGL